MSRKYYAVSIVYVEKGGDIASKSIDNLLCIKEASTERNALKIAKEDLPEGVIIIPNIVLAINFE